MTNSESKQNEIYCQDTRKHSQAVSGQNPKNCSYEYPSIIRVFPRRTNWTPVDPLAFFGPPPLFRPQDSTAQVHVSVTFTWDKSRGEELARQWSAHYRDVRIGGPAYARPGLYADEFTPGLYLKDGCTITSRGCPKACGYCGVSIAEGPLRTIPIRPGWIVQDNNLLACSDYHVRAVFEMLRSQGRRIAFNGGLDKDYLRDWHRSLFDSIPIHELWFACDRVTDLPRLERAAKILEGIPQRKLRCYVLLGYEGESLDIARRKVERVFALGFLPFSQLYQGETLQPYSREWRELNRKWSRPAAMLAKPLQRSEVLFT